MELRGFAAFADESQVDTGRYRSIAAVSVPTKDVVLLQQLVREHLQKGCVDELKWHKLKSAKMRFCAERVLDCFLDDFLPRSARVDILIWDIEDSRHRIQRRDDGKNFERMFFHLHKVLMTRRTAGEPWHLRPDERLDVDWETIRRCIASVGGWPSYFNTPLLGDSVSVAQFNVASFKQTTSTRSPLNQVADMFAGLAAYSRLRAADFHAWLRAQGGQGNLFDEPSPLALTGRDKERFPFIYRLYERCRQRGLGVSLRTNGYLRTLDPSNPINFWHYTPQHATDQAPTIESD